MEIIPHAPLEIDEIFNAVSSYDEESIFDIRCNCFYGNNEKPSSEAGINESIVGLEEKLMIKDSPEARFILFNAINHQAGKHVYDFSQKKYRFTHNNLLNIIKSSGNENPVEMLNLNPVMYKKDRNSLISALQAGNIFDVEYDSETGEKGNLRMNKNEFEAYLLHEISCFLTKSFDMEELRERITEKSKNIAEKIFSFYKCELEENSEVKIESLEMKTRDYEIETMLQKYILTNERTIQLDFEWKKGEPKNRYGIAFGPSNETLYECLLDTFDKNLKGLKDIFQSISDEGVEYFEKKSSNCVITSFVINYAMRFGKKTRTCISFDGKGRDFFLSGISLNRKKVEIANMGEYALSGANDIPLEYEPDMLELDKPERALVKEELLKSITPEYSPLMDYQIQDITQIFSAVEPKRFCSHEIDYLSIGKAGNDFMRYSDLFGIKFNAGVLGENALSGSNELFSSHDIEYIDVREAGGNFMQYSTLIANTLKAGILGENALSGFNKGISSRFGEYIINRIIIGKAGKNFMDCSSLTAESLKADEIGANSLCGMRDYNLPLFASHNIDKLTVKKTGESFMRCAHIKAKSIRINELGRKSLRGMKNRLAEINVRDLKIEKKGRDCLENVFQRKK
ncbi:MAG: hypothetical protein NTV63_03950 [Candidatus Woesearchaeota archaeon]|nr:hypothetical protein [Candidatus Woesearchaeota archaeon]